VDGPSFYALGVSYSRGDLRDQLTHVGAETVRAGLVIGSGGNLSARQPDSDQCWITAANTWLDRLRPAEFSLISIPDGELRGGHPNPSSEWRLHTETYARRPDVNAIVHLHPQTSVLLTGGDPRRVPQVPARFLEAVGQGEASV
jgi:L-fuculose-phosphate aldolase